MSFPQLTVSQLLPRINHELLRHSKVLADDDWKYNEKIGGMM